jgi:hypothetical protein
MSLYVPTKVKGIQADKKCWLQTKNQSLIRLSSKFLIEKKLPPDFLLNKYADIGTLPIPYLLPEPVLSTYLDYLAGTKNVVFLVEFWHICIISDICSTTDVCECRLIM